MFHRWCEVELLLRRRIANDKDIDVTLQAARNGLKFMEEVIIYDYYPI